jgi:hypothetical protein
MTHEEFNNTLQIELQHCIQDRYGIQAETEIRQITKTNVTRDNLTIRFDDSSIAPSIPVEPLYKEYESGTSLQDIVTREAGRLYQAYREHPDLPVMTPEEARKHVTLTLINTDMNRDLLAHTPNFPICGSELSAIPRWYISPEASFVVSNDITAKLGMTPDEILQIGQKNIEDQEYTIKGMGQIMSEMAGIDYEPSDADEQMLVLTTEDKIQGAKAILSKRVMDDVHDRLGDFVVLPSSIHEVICIPREGADIEDLKVMVREINSTQVAPEERLSDNVMTYDGLSLKLAHNDLKMEPMVTQSMSFGISM